MQTDPFRHLAACMVPFLEDERIDFDGLRSQMDFLLETGLMTGLVVNAHAGEGDSLTREERLEVIDLAVSAARPGGFTTVAAISPSPDTTEAAIDMAREAKAAGADAVMLLAPRWFGWGVGPEDVVRYVSAVAEGGAIPMLYFVAGAYAGVRYTPEIVERLARIPGVIGIKDTSWTTQGFEANLGAVRRADRDVKVLSGNDTILFYNFVAGADGTLLVLHTLFPEMIVEMFEAVQTGDINRAKVVNDRLVPAANALFEPPMLKAIPRLKEALVWAGRMESSRVRAPLPELSPEEREALRRVLDAAVVPVG
ncbi:MAG: dihydrodipicolinate synthase family protein [Nitrospinota bacterium]|nr:dihydrodipicolinate synthase family protein [Nitrospinota bacterium]HJM44041.1 dihydrodipicolinate synthase family protein [Nitrospinota bacterium]